MSDKMNSTKNRFVLTQYPILKTNNLCVSRSGKQILHDVNLSVNSGEFVGIVGPNGSGKSTLLLTILGVLQSQKGTVEIYGRKTTPTREVYEKISWVSQAAANLPKEIRITVRELVQLGTVKLSNLLFETDKSKYSSSSNGLFFKLDDDLTEQNFAVFGSNSSAGTNTNNLPSGTEIKSSREWQIDEHGDIQVNIFIDISAATGNTVTPADASILDISSIINE